MWRTASEACPCKSNLELAILRTLLPLIVERRALMTSSHAKIAAIPFMDFSLSDHQVLLRDTVRDFMNAEVRTHVKEWERTEHFPIDAIKKLGALGCCGMLTPEAWGGAGFDTISYVLMIEEVARVHAAMSTALAVTNSAVQLPMLAFATDAQKSKYLKPLAAGEYLGAFCLTEPQAGSDAAGIQAAAVRDGEKYVLNGTKTWVTNGSVAGVFIVFAKTQPELGGKGISAFLIEPVFPGIKVGRHEDKMGQRSSPSVEIILNHCEVPAANRLGEEGQGLKIALSALDGGRIGIAAQAVGLAQAALDEAVKYARTRKAFGKFIGEFQAIQWMIADVHTEIEAARALLYNAAFLKESGGRMGSAASRAKLYASEMVNRVAHKAVQIFGSQGYSRESEVERIYRDARVISIYEGTSEIQRTIIARDLLTR